MTREEIEREIKKIFIEQLNIDGERIKPETLVTQESDIYPDSLGIIEVLISVEEEFDIDISDEDAYKLKTIKDVVDYVESNT